MFPDKVVDDHLSSKGFHTTDENTTDMAHEAPATDFELDDASSFGNRYHSRSSYPTSTINQKSVISHFMENANDPSRLLSPLDNEEQTLLKLKLQRSSQRGTILLYCLPHTLPLTVTIVIILLNILGLYWQDLGRPKQSTILQALQYAAKAHEVTMAASLTAIVVNQVQYDMNSSKGIPLGFLTAGFRLSDPSFILRRSFSEEQ